MKLKDMFDGDGLPLSNIADKLSDEQLAKLGNDVQQMTDRDLATMSDWLELTDEAMKIAKQVLEIKNFPWPDASNVKYPLITGAAIQFAARAYAEIIKGNEVVKGKVVGADPTLEKAKKALRISRHMSYQLLEQMTEWEPQVDQMLHMLPVIGTCFKKTSFCPLKGRNVSELVKAGPGGLIFDNKNTKDLETARRLTHEFPLYSNDIVERIKSGIYRDVDITKLIPADSDGDEQAPHTMREQHRWDDFDEDGYLEPYVVTVHKDSGEVLRVVPRFDANSVMVTEKGEVIRIEPLTYFTKFGFFPDPEGGFLDLGFGHILYPINESINTVLNQLLDAGTLANTGGGFVARGFRIKAQTFSLSPGEWKQIDVPSGDLRNSLMPNPSKEPSMVLFQLLGFLVEAGKGLASQTEVLQGEQPAANVPATTVLALIEQGLKVYNSIYKRFYRSMKEEFKKLRRLNKIYLEEVEYFNVLDEETAVAREDYEDANVDVLPVADPNASTEIQRMARAQALMQIRQDPLANGQYILTQYVDAIGDDPKQALVDPATIQPPPDPKLLELQEKMIYNKAKLDIEGMLAQSEVDLNKSIELANIAKAEAAEAGNQFEQYMTQLLQIHTATMQMYESLHTMMQGQQKSQGQETAEQPGEVGQNDESGVPAMEGTEGNEGLHQLPEGTEGVTGKVIEPATDGRLDAASNAYQGGAD